MRELTYGEAIREALREEMRLDESVFLLGEDLYIFGGPFRILKGLGEEFGRKRVLDTPISEVAIVGAAVGAAVMGMRPIAEIMYMDFCAIASDMIINLAAKIHFMSAGKLKAPLVIRTQQGPGAATGPQHTGCFEAIFAHIPGLLVVLPSTPYDAKGLLKSSIRNDNPVMFIEHRRSYHRLKGPVPEEEYLLPLGKADIKREGSDVSVVAISGGVSLALEAAKALEKDRISLEIIDPMTIKPLDEDTIIKSVKKTGRLIIVHEACKTGGFGAEIAALISEKAFDYLKTPIKRIAALDIIVPYSVKYEGYVFPSVNDVVIAAREIVK